MTDSHIAQVRQLSEWLQGTDITLLELSGPGEKLVRLRREAGVAARTQPTEDPALDAAEHPPAGARQPVGWVREATPATAATAAIVVRAGSVGILLHAHPLRSEPLARVGQEVAAGQPLALLKIGLVLLPVAAPRAGTVARILAAHESAVGFGDALLELA